MLDIDFLKRNDLIIFECLSGSKAYGTDTSQSDTDIKGVFIMPEDLFFGFEECDQISDERNDIVYYELKKFIHLLSKNNPNIIEMIYSPPDCVLKKEKIFELIKPEMFLSKLCRETFAGYALDQIKRSRGLNKKIANPVDEKKKSILEFCYVTDEARSQNLLTWLEKNKYSESNCGLSALPHFEDFYALYYDKEGKYGFNGIIKKDDKSFDVVLSRIPEDLKPDCYLYYNRNGYKNYVRKYNEYWSWVKTRNEARYETTIMHGKNYDSKNMMHTMRLLLAAEEIARDKIMSVRRPEREFLLDIKAGKYEYEELIKMAEEKIDLINRLFDLSDLQEHPDLKKINCLLVDMRKNCYKEKKKE